MKRRYVALVTVAAAGVAIAGSVTALGSRSGARPVQFNARPLSIARSASNVSPQVLLTRIVSSLDDPTIDSMTLGDAPSWFEPTADPSIPPPASFVGAPWLFATMTAEDSYAGQAKAIWIAELAAGALRDEMYANGQQPIYSVDITLKLSDGRTIKHAGGGIGDVQYGQNFADDSDGVIEARIRNAARTAGYDVNSIEIVHADDQPAPAVELTAPDPATAATDPGSLMQALFGAPGTYEGTYLAVNSPDGAPVLDNAAAFRVGVSLGWSNPVFGGASDTGAAPSAGN